MAPLVKELVGLLLFSVAVGLAAVGVVLVLFEAFAVWQAAPFNIRTAALAGVFAAFCTFAWGREQRERP